MDERRKKIILTGATGAIGLAVLEACIQRGWEVCAIVNPKSFRKNRIPRDSKICVIECDLSEIETLCKLAECRGADFFVHLAWDGTYGEDRWDEKRQYRNAEYARIACRVAKELGCEVFLFAGSQAEFGRVEGRINGRTPTNPENPYGAAKLLAGQSTRELCKQLNLRHIYMRILSVYGPGDGENTMISSTIRSLREGRVPEFTPAEQMWDYLYSADAADALLDAAMDGRSDRIYCLGSGVARPLREYIEIISTLVNPKVPLGIGALPYADKQVMYLCADISDMEEDFGFVPKVDFEEGIRRLLKIQ